MEELLALKKADLQKLADEKGIAYTARTTNQELAELIHAHDEKTEQDENAKNTDVSQAVAQANESAGEDVPPLGIIVPNQTIKVQVRQENGELVEEDALLDDFIGFDHAASNDMNVLSIDYESLVSDDSFMIVEGQTLKVVTKQDGELVEGFINADIIIDGSDQRIIQLEQEKADLTAKNVFLEDTIKAKDLMISELELREVATGFDLGAGSDVGVETVTALQKPTWDNNVETMPVRVRITPNKGLTGRIRAGMQFGVQYSEHEIDKATFDALINDAYLQVEILERDNDG